MLCAVRALTRRSFSTAQTLSAAKQLTVRDALNAGKTNPMIFSRNFFHRFLRNSSN
jgi:hypothetical protein